MSLSRCSGVLMHISSLWGSDSIGCFGKEARTFVDRLAEGGFTWWQVLPFCMADECHSPYKSYSAFGGNPYFVDLRQLAEAGYLTEEELAGARQDSPWVAEYDKLDRTRMDLLRLAAGRTTPEEKKFLEKFAKQNPYLEQFCRFMAIRKENDDKPWYEWTHEKPDRAEHLTWRFIQYHFMKQWQEIRCYANERGIRILGDIPIYVSYDSCDVYANRAQFQLDETGAPSAVAGCPPDYFSEDGQLWGNPLYDWKRMEGDNFAWWADRMRHMLTLFDGVRIDHFRGLEAYWSIPADAETAREGHWEPGPREAFVHRLHEVVNEMAAKLDTTPLIVAEDLGEFTPELKAFVEGSGFPGMRVLQFAFDGDPKNLHLPHNMSRHTVAYTGTHDNDTLLGYIWGTDGETRRRMLTYCGFTADNWDTPAASEAVIRTLLRSNADMAILPIQDVLGHGSDTRMNTPGEAHGNWRYRVTAEQINGVNWQAFRDMNQLYGRI